MILVERIALNLTAIAFVALGVATAIEWYRHRDSAGGRLAISLVLLGIVAGLGRLPDVIGQSTAVAIITIVAFIGSGYFVLLFRDAFLPLSRRVRRAADVLLAVTCILGVAEVTLFAYAGGVVSTIFAVELILTWAVFTGEPVLRFWIASEGMPSVQKSRLRALSFGFAVLIVILIVDVLGGTALQSPLAVITTQLIAMAIVPVIYVSFAPPSILRRIWRMGEESELRLAIQDLLIFSPTRQVLAEKAAGWAKRLLGAEGAFILDPEGNLMAATGIELPAVEEIMAARDIENGGGLAPAAWGGRAAIIVPLSLTEGTGFLGITSGPFTPLFGSDEVNQVQGYASSVTAGLERARVTERLAAIERNKTQFLNLASHELRGPLTVVRGYIDMLEAGLLGNLNERGLKAVPVIAAKVLEMNTLIEQMIEAARLEDGALMLRPVQADLRAIVRGAVEAVGPIAGEYEMHPISVECPERAVSVQVDAERIKTIIANLVSNAVKYSPAGGPIDVRLTSRGGVARVAVKDSGVGIAKDDQPVLFTRFGRISTPQTDHLPGTGLGLYLGRQLARLHGGEITVESTPGQGSTFTLHLPVAGVKPARKPARSSAAVTG